LRRQLKELSQQEKVALAEFALRGINGRVDEITEVLNDLQKEIYEQYGNKQ
jgi:hypothetical protein